MNNELLQIATVGKAVGLRGELKFYLDSDFEGQFKKGSQFDLKNGDTVEIESYNHQKSLVKFLGFNNREDAQKLTNQKLFTTVEKTRAQCTLEDGEYFWFDMIGVSVYDSSTLLGIVEEIERIGTVDYLVIKTTQILVDNEYSKKFYIPYIEAYIRCFDLDNKRIETEGGLSLLEAS
ncbi:MAG: ribosome maturation factor RimM [Epsilonproteobacteria bacterium]|nr:ribosome maturation factor RimM [Campylobacterota bacterium]